MRLELDDGRAGVVRELVGQHAASRAAGSVEHGDFVARAQTKDAPRVVGLLRRQPNLGLGPELRRGPEPARGAHGRDRDAVRRRAIAAGIMGHACIVARATDACEPSRAGTALAAARLPQVTDHPALEPAPRLVAPSPVSPDIA
jgi:hypothetical protein